MLQSLFSKMDYNLICIHVVTELDFRFPVGAPLHGINAFLSTNQLKVLDLVNAPLFRLS